MHPVPAWASATASVDVRAVITTGCYLGANPTGRGWCEGTSTLFCNAPAQAPLGKAAIPVMHMGLVQYKLFVALPGKIAPEAQEGVDVDTVHVASVLHVTAQVEFRQQALGSFLLGMQRGP